MRLHIGLSRGAVAAPLGLAACAALASAPSAASTSSDSPEVRASGEITETLVKAQGEKATTSPALAQDFNRFAKQTGRDVTEVEEQFRGIKEFGKLATELEEKWLFCRCRG